MAYTAEPFTFAGVSRRGTSLPIRRKSFLFLSSLTSTAGSVAGILPKPAISP
jgi:hypothetical protein